MWNTLKGRLRDLGLSSPNNHAHTGHHPRNWHRRCPSSNAVQHALNIAEIARVVAFHVEDRRTLFALALTNRALSEPALDALWAECNLWHLARLMPSKYWVDEAEVHVGIMGGDRLKNNRNLVLCLTDIPREGAWLGKRFLYYSKRIKSIWIRRRDDRRQIPAQPNAEGTPPKLWANLTVHPDVIIAWTQLADILVFPRLIELRVDEVIFREEWDSNKLAPRLAAASALVHAGLRCVSIETPVTLGPRPYDDSPTQADIQRLYSAPLPLLERVRDVCAGSLHDLRLLAGPRGWSPPTAKLVSSVLVGTDQLTTLVLGGAISAENFMHVARLPRLTTLHVHGPVKDEFYVAAAQATLFPALEELRIADDALPRLFPDVVSSRRVRIIIIELWILPSLESLSRFLFALEDQKALEVLEVAQDTTQQVRGAPTFRTPSIFGLRDLLDRVSSFPKLKTLSLASLNDFDSDENKTLAESALLASAARWPRLQQLDIFVGNCRISFKTLTSLLKICPNLSSLNIGIDLATQPTTTLLQHRYEHLHFVSVIGSPRNLANTVDFLNRSFPNLMGCRAHTSYSHIDLETAKQLNAALVSTTSVALNHA